MGGRTACVCAYEAGGQLQPSSSTALYIALSRQVLSLSFGLAIPARLTGQ